MIFLKFDQFLHSFFLSVVSFCRATAIKENSERTKIAWPERERQISFRDLASCSNRKLTDVIFESYDMSIAICQF